MTKEEREQYQREWEHAKSNLFLEMTRHLGESRKIGAGELFQKVFRRAYEGNKISGTRALRKLIEEVKYGSEAIMIAHSCTNRGGYYIPVTDTELLEYRDRCNRQVKEKIGRLAKLFGINAAAYAGQLALEMRGGAE
jgi:hypothetical protein